MGYIPNSEYALEDYLLGDGWIDLQAWARRPLNRLPLEIRNQDEGYTHCNSLMPLIEDPACDPYNGGVAGNFNMAKFYTVGVQQFRKNIRPQLDFLRFIGGIPLSNISSLQNHASKYETRVRQNRCERIGMIPTNSLC